MKILFNASPAVRPVTGIGTYARELIRHLLEIDKSNQYTLFSIKSPFPNRRVYFNCPKAENLSCKSFVFPYRYLNILWRNLRLFPVERFFGEVDVLHSLDKVAPFTKKAKVIITIHDMTWYMFGSKGEKKGLIYKQIIDTLKRSSAIITDSEFSKTEIIRYLPFTEGKIHVVQLGVADKFYPMERNSIPPHIHRKYPWDDYLLYIGILDDPRKNLEGIITAYAALKKRKKIKEKLILCGGGTINKSSISRLLKKVNLPDDIIVYSRWIPEEEVPYIYNKARLVLLPSFYEGFGLPVLESMACGKPVIASDIPPLKEIAKDAAIFVDPKDTVGLSDAMEMLLSDERLYTITAEKGLSRSKEFSWTRTARETLKIYEKCGER